MKTFQEIYCARHGCRTEEFARRMFWRALHRWAIPWVPLVAVLRPEYFAPDRELLDDVARVTTWRQLDEELRDYAMDARNLSWWRRRIRWRISTHRLRRIGAHYLAGGGALHATRRATA